MPFYLLFIQLGARRLWPVERGNENNNGSRKQTRKPDKRKSPTGPPPAPIHPCSVIQNLSRKLWRCPLSGTSSLVLHSISVFVVLAVCMGSPPGVRPFLPLYPSGELYPKYRVPNVRRAASFYVLSLFSFVLALRGDCLRLSRNPTVMVILFPHAIESILFTLPHFNLNDHRIDKHPLHAITPGCT